MRCALAAQPGFHPRSGPQPDRRSFLLLYGTADKQVPIALTDRFVEALRANKHPHLTYLRFDGVDHSPWWQQWEKYHVPAVKDSRAQIERFFDRTLKNEKG
jgi:fermentation-respiration switch protein FrsA (DUF1100 family)